MKEKGLSETVISKQIYEIRGEKVMLDSDLAEMYGSTTKALNQAIKRNLERFPPDFTFRLTIEEVKHMRSQIVTASKRNVRYQPLAFTEHGALMAANVLNSPKAAQMSVYVVRAFVRMREALSRNRWLIEKLDELEKKVGTHDADIHSIFEMIRCLLPDKYPPRHRIGFD